MLMLRAAGPDEKVRLEPPPVMPAAIFAQVEQIWREEKTRRGDRLFNGRMFSVSSSEPGSIIGWLAEYKCLVAQRREPNLFATLRVCPLAVTGLLRCADGIVFGRRTNDIEQDAGLWELVPSGGIDGSTANADGSVDLGAQIIKELAEEIGIPAESLMAPPQPFALVHDSDSHVWDMALALRTSLAKSEIVAAFSALGHREHSELEFVTVGRLTEFIGKQNRYLAQVSASLLAAQAARAILR
jgi:hypothetical protein